MADTSDFWRVQVVGSATSTQDLVRGLAETGEPEGLAIQALQQTAGRGRHGNGWTSPMGNLYLSVLLRPFCKADQAGQMAFVIALALSDALNEVIEPGHAKTLKWPNDILVGGKKISGILLETKLDPHGRLDYLIVGTGVNIFAPPEGAESLDRIKAAPVFINSFRDLYLEKLRSRTMSWQEQGFAGIREDWLSQAHGIGQAMTIRLPEISYDGVFSGIDADGALIATVNGAERRFTAGDVHFGVN